MIATALAELRVRLREPGFVSLALAIVATTTLLVPPLDAPYATLTVDGRRVALSAGVAGMEAGLVFGTIAALFGLFAFVGGFRRDERTGLAEVLRAQPINPSVLVAGRILGVVLVALALDLAAMVILGCTLALRLLHAFQPLSYVTSFLVLSLPALLVTATLSVLLELIWLRRTAGFIVAALVTWLLLLGLARIPATDIFGLDDVQREASATFGRAVDVSAGIVASPLSAPIVWAGVGPDVATFAHRGACIVVALGLAFVTLPLSAREVRSVAIAPESERRNEMLDFGKVMMLPRARGISVVRAFLIDAEFRIRKSRLLLFATLALGILGAIIPAFGQRAVGALALLFPLFWSHSYDAEASGDADALAQLAGSASPWRDAAVRTASVTALSMLALSGLVLRFADTNPVAAATLLGACTLESAWLLFAATASNRGVIGLAVAGLFWYVAAFNTLDAPFDYAGLTDPRWTTAAGDLVLTVALVVMAATVVLMRKRRG